jgi:Rad3-related DNA helicase
MSKNKRELFEKRKLITNELLFESILEDFTLRESQEKAMAWFKKSIEGGKKFFILDAPPGSGKSLLSQLIIKFYLSNVNSKAKFDLLTCNKNLQTQYLDDFPYLNNLWGKSNYRCDKHDNNCEYGKVCNNNKGEKCEDCPHTKSFERWMDGKISLTNFHIHGLYSIFMPDVIEQRNSNMLIVDEAHSLEQTINSFVSFNISKKQWAKFVTNDISNKWENDVFDLKTSDELVEWIKRDYILALEKAVNMNSAKMKHAKGKELEKVISMVNEIVNLKNSIDKFIVSYESKTSKWVIDKKNIKGVMSWDIQPLWTDNILNENLWKNYNHVVLMSGTILDPKMFCELNGINIDDVAYIKLGMTFPKSNRPIYYIPVGKMSYNNKIKCWEDMKPYIEKILKKYDGKKGIIHVGNYELLEWMKRDFGKNKRFIFASPQDRQESIDKHISSKIDSILVSPSMTQGIDLKDDLSRFQLILKMPYPSLASKVNKMRFDSKPTWYPWATIIDLIQSYGRSIRSDDDFADTIILDSCLSDLMTQNSNIFPKYFIDAIEKIKINNK